MKEPLKPSIFNRKYLSGCFNTFVKPALARLSRIVYLKRNELIIEL
jgi:hypothetical protein